MGRTSDARKRLVESAVRLFHARSYGAVSVDDLCRAARVQKGSCYHFFPSKRDVALAAIEAQWVRTREGLLEPAFAADAPPLDRIARFFTMAAALQSVGPTGDGCIPGCPFGNLAIELATQEPAIAAKVREVFDGFRAYIEGAVRDAEQESLLDAVDVPAAAHAVLALFEGALLLAKTSNDPALIERFGLDAVRLVGRPFRSGEDRSADVARPALALPELDPR